MFCTDYKQELRYNRRKQGKHIIEDVGSVRVFETNKYIGDKPNLNGEDYYLSSIAGEDVIECLVYKYISYNIRYEATVIVN